MMTLAALATLVGVWLAGHAVLGLARPTRPRGPLERHATAVLAGAALATSALMHAVIAAGPLSPMAGRGLLLVLALGGLPFAFRRGERPPLPPDRPGIGGRLLAASAIAFAAFAAFEAASMPMHIFDPVYHFSYKAKLVYQEGFGTDAWKDVDGLVGRVITHPNYAPGAAVLNALVGLVNGAFDEDAFRALCAIFVLVPAAWLFVLLRPRGFVPAACGALAWVALPILHYTKLPCGSEEAAVPGWLPPTLPSWGGAAYAFLFGTAAAKARFPDLAFGVADGQILDGGTDLVQGAFLFGAVVHLWRLLPAARLPSDRADVVAGGLLLSGTLLAKNEGLALTAVVAIAFVLALAGGRLAGVRPATDGPRVRPLVGLALVLALGFGASAGWFAIRGDIPSIDEDYPSRMNPATIAEHWPRWLEAEWDGMEQPGVLQGFSWTFLHVLRWNLLWPLFFAAVAWSCLRPRRFLASPASFAVLVVLGAMALYALILLVTPWHLGVLFGTVIPDRLLVHVAPVVVAGTLALLWRFEREEDPRGAG